jgi:hypothetical protein
MSLSMWFYGTALNNAAAKDSMSFVSPRGSPITGLASRNEAMFRVNPASDFHIAFEDENPVILMGEWWHRWTGFVCRQRAPDQISKGSRIVESILQYVKGRDSAPSKKKNCYILIWATGGHKIKLHGLSLSQQLSIDCLRRYVRSIPCVKLKALWLF